MSAYHVTEIRPGDRRAWRQVDALLAREGLARDAHLDETYGLADEDETLVATGSLFAGTLRCIAVDSAHRGEGLLATLMTALLERQLARGHAHVFLYTRPETAPFFAELGFYEVARVGDGADLENRTPSEGFARNPLLSSLVFMENRRGAFAAYLAGLGATQTLGCTASIVMNANPFTRGHQYLVERAAAENDAVRCFVVSEDVSLVPFADRLALVKAGCGHLSNVTVHDTGSYMVSNATFPSYFLKEARAVTEAQARLDIEVFVRIARATGITRRYIGEEPFSTITQIYNDVMREALPAHGIECVLLDRLAEGGAAISASDVRQRLHDGGVDSIRAFVPETTYAYFQTDAGRETIRRIRAAEHVRHE